jgi:hypothetical protein
MTHNLQTLQTIFLVFNPLNRHSGMIAIDKQTFTRPIHDRQITKRTDHAKQTLAIISCGVRYDAASFNHYLCATAGLITRSGCRRTWSRHSRRDDHPASSNSVSDLVFEYELRADGKRGERNGKRFSYFSYLSSIPLSFNSNLATQKKRRLFADRYNPIVLLSSVIDILP